MLAPHLSGLLIVQWDFGHPAGAVLGDTIVSETSPKILLVAWITAMDARCTRCVDVFRLHRN